MIKLDLQALKTEMIGDLNRYNIHLLREQGSRLGIKSVTTHNKEKLVELIVEKKLRNHKSYEIDSVPENIDEVSIADKERLVQLNLDSDGIECEMVSGFLDLNEGIDGFLRILQHKKSSNDVFVPQSIINNYQLRYGDRLVGKAVEMQASEWRGLIDVSSINGAKPPLKRKNFSAFTASIAEEKIPLCEKEDSLFGKMNSVSPIAKGQRNVVFCKSPMDITKITSGMTKSLENSGVATTILCLSEKPEMVATLKKQFGKNVVSLDCDESRKDSQRVAQLTLETLKREAESGKSVALVVTNMAALCEEKNRQVLEKEFSYKTLFASARNLENFGSLTVIGFAFLLGALGENIYETLVPLSNSMVVLSKGENGYEIDTSYTDFFLTDKQIR